MPREYFLSFSTSKITGKVELTKKATGKTSAILCIRYDNCLDTAKGMFGLPCFPIKFLFKKSKGANFV